MTDGSASRELRIRLLGDLEVARAGCAVALPASKRTRALLGYLVATDAPPTRQTLCDLLWDGPDDPRGALRWSLSKLRDVVNDDGAVRLTADRERVAFVRRDVVIDVDQVRALLPAAPEHASLEALEQAAGLLRGEFLDGLDLPVCHRFHHWCMAERERLGAVRRRVLGQLVERLRQDPPRALPFARALVTADPLAENAHAALLHLLIKAGRRPEAEAHYRRASDFLRQEVGVAAAETLRAALREARIKRAADIEARTISGPDLLTPLPIASPVPCVPGPRPALIGREAERRRIIDAVATLANAAPLRPLLFLGEPGIGKTRLLETLANVASEYGARVAFARCFEAEMVRPYGCFMDALRGDFPTLFPGQQRATDAADREQLLANIAAALSESTARQPFVLILDDLQWVDEASASLLHFLARSAIPKLLLAGAARTGEIADNPWAKRLLQSMTRDALLESLPLVALTCEETAILIGLDPGSEDAVTAFRTSGGNPLLALELARGRQRGTDLEGQSLELLVADRLARLGEEEREITVWAAAIGREFRPELLGACLGLGESTLIGRIERLVRHGLLRPTTDGHFDFSHDLLRQGIYRQQSQPHRRLLHRQIASALVAVVADDPSLYGDLVHHAELAEDHTTAVRACIAAGERCRRLFANAQADATAERGLAHLQHLPDGRDRIRQHIALLELKVFASPAATNRDRHVLIDALERMTDAAVLAGLYGEAVTALHVLSWLHQCANDTDRTQQATLRAEKISRTADSATRVQQLANTGRCLLDVESAVPRALALISEAEAMAEAHNLHFVELEWGRALAARWHGELDSASNLMTRALTFARLLEDRRREMECLVWLAMIALERDDLDALDAYCDDVDAAMDRMDRPRAPVVGVLRALAGLKRSRPGTAALLTANLAELRVLDDKGRLAYALNTWASLALDRGDYDDAHTAAQEALAAARVLRRPTEIAVANANLAHVAVAVGDPRAAMAFLAEAQALGGDVGLGARGRAQVERSERALAQRFPTLVQTAVA